MDRDIQIQLLKLEQKIKDLLESKKELEKIINYKTNLNGGKDEKQNINMDSNASNVN